MIHKRFQSLFNSLTAHEQNQVSTSNYFSFLRTTQNRLLERLIGEDLYTIDPIILTDIKADILEKLDLALACSYYQRNVSINEL